MASLITPELILSYPSLFAAKLSKKPNPGEKPAYSTVGLFTAEAIETAEYKAMVAAAVAAAKAFFGDKYEALLKDDKLKMPFRKDVASAGYPDKFVRFMNFRAVADASKPKPQIVGRDNKLITDPAQIYPGVRARVSVGCFAYDTNGNKGVSFGLRNVQKIGDGDRLDSYVSADKEFEPLAPDETADEVASMLG